MTRANDVGYIFQTFQIILSGLLGYFSGNVADAVGFSASQASIFAGIVGAFAAQAVVFSVTVWHFWYEHNKSNKLEV